MAANDAKQYIPAVRYDRVFTDLDLTDGIVDSWPFTPKQIEIIGDKTWVFFGQGRFLSNSVDFNWKLPESSSLDIAYFRVYPDYRLRVTTRDHLSINPWEMIFGKRRVDTDNTRSYDFAAVTFGKEFKFDRFKFETGIRQLVPLRHVKTSIPGEGPEPPEFPKISLKRPKRFGGLSFWGSMRYSF